MDIYINLDALDLKTAAVVSKDDLRSKPVKELVAGENQVINLYTTGKAGSSNIQDYSTVRLGIGTINAVPTSGNYTVAYGGNTADIQYNATAADIKTSFYSVTTKDIQTVTKIAPQTFKIDFQNTGTVSVPSITDDTLLYPSSTVTISELAVGSSNTKASWLLKTNQDALALVDTFTNISPQGITGVLNTATTGIYEKLQSQKFFKTTLEVEVVDSSSRLSTILQVPISVKGEVIGLSIEPPHVTPSPYALITYVDSKTAANATDIATNAQSINDNTYDISQTVAQVNTKAPIDSPDFTGDVEFKASTYSDPNPPNVLTVNNNGYVGVNTNSPSANLEVVGLLSVTGSSGEITTGNLTANDSITYGTLYGGDILCADLDVSGETQFNDDVTFINNATVSGDVSINGELDVSQAIDCPHIKATLASFAGAKFETSSTILRDVDVTVERDITVDGKIITTEIQCKGTTTGTAQPINYDAKEHRFRDFDGTTDGPTHMLVVQKFDGYTGARVGINKDPSASNAVALHIVAGKNTSTQEKDLGLKVTGGGAFLEQFLRVGHYESSDANGNDQRPSSPSNGTIIYDSSTHSFQGYIGGGGGSGGWKTFTMS